jgi:hypothetical protein
LPFISPTHLQHNQTIWHRHIQLFWQALDQMSQEERSKLINFCSGRSRLPASVDEFPMSFKLTAPPPRSKTNPDDYLPIAQTCFFSLSLPEYTNLEVGGYMFWFILWFCFAIICYNIFIFILFTIFAFYLLLYHLFLYETLS